VVTQQVAGRIPTMLGVAGLTAEHAAMFARRAQAVGADSVIAMAPYVGKISDPEGLLAYFQCIAEAFKGVICLQNHAVGTEMSVPTMLRLVNEVERLDVIKEETSPVTHKVSALKDAGVAKLKSVFGGSGGRYMLLEYPRGVDGQMPGCHVTDVMVSYWNALETGDWPEAKRIYGLLSPLYAIETTCHGAIYKEVLRRRGVITSSRGRNVPPNQMDEHDHRSLDDILRDLEPLFTWPGSKPMQYGVDHPVPLSRSANKGGEADPTGAAGKLDAFDR
jgi:dihydrodipicolinate synthase/N-acetylneuraminate lyase